VHLTEYDAGSAGDFFFDVLAYESRKDELPEVPNFESNMRLIIEEFVDKYRDAAAVFSL
jgi:hypothetical protein